MNCPRCGAYNPEGRMQCWKCDTELPLKPDKPKRRGEGGRMGMWTWIILVLLGAVWIFGQCAAPRQTQPSTQRPPAVVRPLV